MGYAAASADITGFGGICGILFSAVCALDSVSRFDVSALFGRSLPMSFSCCDKGGCTVSVSKSLADNSLAFCSTFLDLLTFEGTYPDGKIKKGLSKDYIHSFSAFLQQSFRFAVFSKQLITFNPMQYIKLKRKAEEDMGQSGTQPISHDDYEKLIAYLEKKNPPAVLPIQIAYYAGLRIYIF